MSQLRKNSIKKRPSLLSDGFMSLDNINKSNSFHFDALSDQPSTPIVPSSSRQMFLTDKKVPRSLIGSPLPLRIKDEPFCASTNSLRKTIKLKTEMKRLGSVNRLEKTEKKNQLRLEKVFGFTIQNNASVALDPISGIIAFPAGCVVVGYNPKNSKQFFIPNTVKSPITSVAFSRDGKLLVTGESGKLPKVRIWNVKNRAQLCEFTGHSYRIGAIAFSPDSRLVVSIGSQEDMTINVWEISSNLKIATSRITNKVNAVAFAENGQFFVTVGVRHVRFWYLDNSRSRSKTTMVLSGRNAILGDFMNNTFNDVGCCSLNNYQGLGSMSSGSISSLNSNNSQSYIYVISQAGQLMQFTEQRYLEKWVELQTPKATCLTVCESYIMVGCSRGIVLLFDTLSLTHLVTLPMPHVLGVNINTGNPDSRVTYNPIRYPDVIAGKYDSIHSRITYFCCDHSLYIWDIQDIQNPIKQASHIFHSGIVWSVEPVPLPPEDNGGIIDICSFITCSDDETIRFWHLQPSSIRNNDYQSTISNDICKELLWIIYTDPTLRCLTECDRLLAKNNESNSGTKRGIRSIKISPDHRHLATADREGNLRIYSLLDYTEIYSISAHNGEILSIDYFQSPSVPDLILFCSASRDRVIHVMDPCQGYVCIQTIVDHSGAIFSAKLVETPSDQEIRLVSCGMDKSILFRILQPDESGQTAQFFLNQHLVGKHSQYDMVIAPNNRYAAVACQDRQVRIYNLVSGKQRKSYRGTVSDDGSLLRCAIDPSGTYLATSGSDKYLHILNFTTGEILASVTGHSETSSGLCFLYDLKHLVSVSSDNCIFVWRLPSEITSKMQRRMKELGSPNLGYFPDFILDRDTAPASTCGTVTPQRMSDDMNVCSSNVSICTTASGDIVDNGSSSSFRFSVSALPSWAQKKFSRRDSITFVQVNMLNDFCAGMSTVHERTEESIFVEDTDKNDEFKSRRMSFIATEKVVRDDDSDNVDDEDSESFAGEKDSFDRSTDLETISQQLSTDDENDDDDDDDEDNLINVTPIQKTSESKISYESRFSKCVFDMNKESLNDDFMCASAPPPLSGWMSPKTDDSKTDIQYKNDPDTSNHFSFDEVTYVDDGPVFCTKRRASLTTRYLSIFPCGSNIVDISQCRDECGSTVRNMERSEEILASKTNISSQITASNRISTTKSSNDVSQATSVRRTSELGSRSVPDSHTSAKVKTNDSKQIVRKKPDIGGFSRSISTTPMITSDHVSDSRTRLNKQKSIEAKPNVISMSARPKWIDSKKTKTVRKTCPIDGNDIRNVRIKHSNPSTVSITDNNFKNMDRNHENIYQLKKEKGKEHVIDDVEDMPMSSQQDDFRGTLQDSALHEMQRLLKLQNQSVSDDVKSNEYSNCECDFVKSSDDIDICTDAWIDDLCHTHSTPFLTTMTTKLLRRLISNSKLDSGSQREVKTRLLFEIETVSRHLRSSLDIAPAVIASDVSSALIREIGEKIIEAVKRNLSEYG